MSFLLIFELILSFHSLILVSFYLPLDHIKKKKTSLHRTFDYYSQRRVVYFALRSASLLSDESFSSLQEPGCSEPWLLLFGPAEVCASCSLHCAGNCSALPSLHMERLFAQIAVWVHAPAADCWSLPLLQHHGAKPQLQLVSGSQRLKIVT